MPKIGRERRYHEEDYDYYEQTVTDCAALDLYEQFKRGVGVYDDDPEEQEEYWEYYRSQIEALYRKAEDEDLLILSNGGEEFPVKQSSRGERRKLTAHHKNREMRLKKHMQYKAEFINDPTFHHDHTDRVWFSGRVDVSHREEVRSKREVTQFMQSVPEPELTDQVWEQAWKDWTEEQYWEEVEAQEWEDMQTFDEIEEYYSHESGLARESGIEPEEEEDDNLSSIGVTNNNPYVWEYGVISEGRRFVCEDEESAIWLLHRLEAFYPASTDFSPRLVRR